MKGAQCRFLSQLYIEAFLKYLLNTVDELGCLGYRIKLCTCLIYKYSMVVEGREIYDIRFS